MKINLGLLLCDHVPESLAPRFKDYPKMYETAFAVLDNDISWKVFDVCRGELPTVLGDLDGYVVSGSRQSVNDDISWISELSAFLNELRKTQIPTVGICFGHQLIAKVYGGTVDLSNTGWGVGCKSFNVLESRDWMTGVGINFIVPAFHQEQVVVLPNNSITLASTNYCNHFLVEYDDSTLGIQGHPEFERNYISALLDDRVAALSPEITAEAVKSLNLKPDSVLIRRWIKEFIRKQKV